jgi:phytanoyl-CoA hydroxylase
MTATQLSHVSEEDSRYSEEDPLGRLDMIELRTPRGLSVQVPETIAEDPSPRFELKDGERLRAYYHEHGYAVVRGLLPADDCERLRGLWASEVKPSKDFIYRQATSKVERHVFNAQGWVMNPILNLQSLDPRRFPQFRSFAVKRVLTAPGLVRGMQVLLGEPPKIVQSMYFEGNSATWEHQDSYYLDSEQVGTMAAAWIAMEDIAATAGRFFVCPGSHRIDTGRHNLKNNMADNHEGYIRSVVQKARELDLPIRAPCLRQGDVLLWNAWTIHGSLDSQDPVHSRASVTCHAIAESHRFLQMHTRVRKLDIERVNGVSVHSPKDLSRPTNRAIFHLETHYPRAFYRMKRLGIRWMLRIKGMRNRGADIEAAAS